jgi:hypothetical protein
VHNAELCYQDAKKVQELELLNIKSLMTQVKQDGPESKIASHYTSPLYLANITLCQNNQREILSEEEKD